MPLTDVIFILHIQRDIYLIDVKYIDNKFYEAYNTENTSKKTQREEIMEVKCGTVCRDTLYIIQEYYHLNTEPLFSVLSEDCVWLGIGNLTVFGSEAIKAQFKDGFIMPPFELEEPLFGKSKREPKSSLWCLENICCMRPKNRRSSVRKTETDFLLPMGRRKVSHLSYACFNKYSELVDDEIFPVRNQQTDLSICPETTAGKRKTQ